MTLAEKEGHSNNCSKLSTVPFYISALVSFTILQKDGTPLTAEDIRKD